MSSILVIDLEMICYPDDQFPAGEFPDIIEVGICRMNTKTLQIEAPRSYLVQPESERWRHYRAQPGLRPPPELRDHYYPEQPYFTEITGITLTMLRKSGLRFAHTMELLGRWGFRNNTIAAWGTDWEAIDTECARLGLPSPIGSNRLDIGQLYRLGSGLEVKPGLIRTVEERGLTPMTPRHRAGPDAYNAAQILRKLLLQLRKG